MLAAGATLAVPLAIRGLIDVGLANPAIDKTFLDLLAVAVVLALATACRFYTTSWLGERVVADIRKQVFENVLRQSPAYFETLQTGEVLSRLTSDTTLVQTLVGSSISIALRSALLLVGGIVMMLVTSAWLASIMIVLLLVVVLPLRAAGATERLAELMQAEPAIAINNKPQEIATTNAISGLLKSSLPAITFVDV